MASNQKVVFCLQASEMEGIVGSRVKHKDFHILQRSCYTKKIQFYGSLLCNWMEL
jgi:hypothetical protein